MIYKVTFEKTMWVRAHDKEEAEEKALDEDFILCDEGISVVTRSSLRAARLTIAGSVTEEG